MGDPAIGWIAAIIIGGIAGWLAEQFMKSDMGLLMNIVLGIVGAAIGSAIFSFFGIALGGWLGYLIAGFVGASLLIWIVRAIRGLCFRIALVSLVPSRSIRTRTRNSRGAHTRTLMTPGRARSSVATPQPLIRTFLCRAKDDSVASIAPS